MRNKLLVIGLAAAFAMTGIASANLLSNGDFELGENDPVDPTQPNDLNPVDWTEDHSGGWSNREINGAMPDGYSYALGNAGGYGAEASQDVAVADDGSWYKLSVDSALDAWWMNSGYLKLEFYDAGATLLKEEESAHWTQPGYDTGLPNTNYDLFSAAPAGTAYVTAILGSWGEGGTARFDNAVLEVVPEPATLGLLGLSGLVLYVRRRMI